MATTIKLKRTDEKGKIPSISDLDWGEIAINYHDGSIYMKKNDSDGIAIVEFANSSKSSFQADATIGTDENNTHFVNGFINLNNGMNVNGPSFVDSLRVDSDLVVFGSTSLGNITFDDSDTISSSTGNINVVSDITFNGNVFGVLDAGAGGNDF